MTKKVKAIIFILALSTTWLLYDKFDSSRNFNQLPEWISATERSELLVATRAFFNQRDTETIGKYLSSDGQQWIKNKETQEKIISSMKGIYEIGEGQFSHSERIHSESNELLYRLFYKVNLPQPDGSVKDGVVNLIVNLSNKKIEMTNFTVFSIDGKS